jgi:hypothetical protein
MFEAEDTQTENVADVQQRAGLLKTTPMRFVWRNQGAQSGVKAKRHGYANAKERTENDTD